MKTFEVPTKNNVNRTNQDLFDGLEKQIGFVPNIYAALAHSENALKTYLDFQGAKTSLSTKEKEVVNLAVSQVNECKYCLSAHTAIAKNNGFSEEEIMEIRNGEATFNDKLNALAKLARHITETRGKIKDSVLQDFFDAGYTKENLVDTIVLVGDKTIANYLHNVTQVEIDFPEAKDLQLEPA